MRTSEDILDRSSCARLLQQDDLQREGQLSSNSPFAMLTPAYPRRYAQTASLSDALKI